MEPALSEKQSKGVPPILKLFGTSYMVTCLLLLACGQPWSTALLAAVLLSPLVGMVWIAAAIFLGGPLTALCRKPALVWYLRRSRRVLFHQDSASSGLQNERPVIGGDSIRSWIAAIHRESFVQISLGPLPEDSMEMHLLPSFEARAKCRVMIARDGACYWGLSQNGHYDLTSEQARDWAIGDEAFDGLVRLIRPVPHALAVLTFDRRKRLLGILEDRWQQVSLQCKPAVIQIVAAGRPLAPQSFLLPSYPRLRETIDALAEFLRELTIADEELGPALLANAATEPSGITRRQNLEALVSLKPEREQLDQAVALACRDQDPLVRVWAAKAVGGEWALDVLCAVVQIPQVGFVLRLEAVNHLLKTWPTNRVWPALERAFQLFSWTDRPAVLDAMLGTRNPALLSLFADFLKRWDPEPAVDAIYYLGNWGQPFVEDALLDVLASDNFTIRMAALRALGDAGTRRVLPSLFDLTSDVHLREGVEAAIRKIQAREHLGEAGQLSLAGPQPQAGAVSVTEPEGGLELAEDAKNEA
jgi:hypothetical protein